MPNQSIKSSVFDRVFIMAVFHKEEALISELSEDGKTDEDQKLSEDQGLSENQESAKDQESSETSVWKPYML